MPIVDVEIVSRDGGLPHGTANKLADAIGAALEAPIGATWVRVRVLDADRYAESGTATGIRPVFVSILRRTLPDLGARASMSRAVASAVSAILGRPHENVHVIWEPEGAGRVAFGGELVPPDEPER